MYTRLRGPIFSLMVASSFAQADALPCRDAFEPASGNHAFGVASAPSIPDDAVIGKIYITRLPIFDESDPDENNALFRWANRFHVLTKQLTVEQDLLFKSGDAYDAHTVDESGRILRGRDHLYDAEVRPVSHCDKQVDVEVITRDIWSFTPEVSFDRSGGENSSRFGVAETNLFGRGRQLSFTSINNTDRNSTRFGYGDPDVAGKRLDLLLQYTDSDDGFHQFSRLQLPFFSLDSRTAWLASVDKVKREEQQYFRGREVTEVRHEIEEYIVNYGFSDGLNAGETARWRLGYVFREDHFSPTVDLPAPASFPIDKRLSYPYVEYASIGDKYIKVHNLDQIHRTEDLHLGHQFRVLAGFAARTLGSDNDRLLVRGSYNNAWVVDRDNKVKTVIKHGASIYGLYNEDTGKGEDVIAAYEFRYYRPQTDHRSFFVNIDAVYTYNLNTNQQVVMGGLSGTRAYDNRLQAGNRSLLLTLEERQYTDVHFLNLIRLGFAVFADIGRAWTPGVDDGLENGLLANVGFGIRLASSKANIGRIVHIDFAFPLTNRDDPAVDLVQIAVNIKDTF